ncbi:MAG: hypothetical protein ACXVZM_04065 [Terriglobales bacterium]
MRPLLYRIGPPLETRGEQFVQAIASLDRRIAAMQELVLSVSPYVFQPKTLTNQPA